MRYVLALLLLLALALNHRANQALYAARYDACFALRTRTATTSTDVIEAGRVCEAIADQ